MKLTKLEKNNLHYLNENHFGEYFKTQQVVEDELSRKQAIFCVCGRLATGMHESSCRKFRTSVDKETVARLKHLVSEADG